MIETLFTRDDYESKKNSNLFQSWTEVKQFLKFSYYLKPKIVPRMNAW